MERCKHCGCFMAYENNSYQSEGGWTEDEGFVCNNSNCKSKQPIKASSNSKYKLRAFSHIWQAKRHIFTERYVKGVLR